MFNFYNVQFWLKKTPLRGYYLDIRDHYSLIPTCNSIGGGELIQQGCISFTCLTTLKALINTSRPEFVEKLPYMYLVHH